MRIQIVGPDAGVAETRHPGVQDIEICFQIYGQVADFRHLSAERDQPVVFMRF